MITIYVLYAYLIIGLAFAFFFVFGGSEIIHHSVKKGSPGLKLLLIPASVMLWPYLVKRIIQKNDKKYKK